MTGEYEDAIRDGKSALVIFQELGDRLHLANALSKLGVAERRTGRRPKRGRQPAGRA